MTERKKGQPILMVDMDGFFYRCSECREELTRHFPDIYAWRKAYPNKFNEGKQFICPGCGAELVEEMEVER